MKTKEEFTQNTRTGFVAWCWITFIYCAVAWTSFALVMSGGGWRMWKIHWILEGGSGWSTDATGRDWPWPWLIFLVFFVTSGACLYHWVWFLDAKTNYDQQGRAHGNKQTDEGDYNVNAVNDKIRHPRMWFIIAAFDVGLFVIAANLADMNHLGNMLFGGGLVLLMDWCIANIGRTTRWPFYTLVLLTSFVPWLLAAINTGRFDRIPILYRTAFWLTFAFEIIKNIVMVVLHRVESLNHLVQSYMDQDQDIQTDKERIHLRGTRSEVFRAYFGSRMMHFFYAFVYFCSFVIGGVTFACALGSGALDGRISNTVDTIEDFNHRYAVGKIAFTAVPAILMLQHFFIAALDSCCQGSDASWMASWAVIDANNRRPNAVVSIGTATAESVFFLVMCAASGISEFSEVMFTCMLVLISGLLFFSLHGKVRPDLRSIQLQDFSDPFMIIAVIVLQLSGYIYASVTVSHKPEVNYHQSVFVYVMLGLRCLKSMIDLIMSYLIFGAEGEESAVDNWKIESHGTRVQWNSFINMCFFGVGLSYAYGGGVLIEA